MSSAQITPMLNHKLFILVIVVASIVTLTTIGQNCSIQQFNQTIRGKNSSKATTLLASISNSLSYETLMSTSGSARDQQKVIILAGPHKTGSTSIQNNFHEWTGKKKYLLKQWSWPVPPLVTKYESQDENNWDWNPSKGFYALAELLRNQKYKITNRLVFQKNTREDILHAYEMEFLKAWMAGYSLIIGSEAFDNVIKDDDGDDIIDRFMDLLPLLGDEDKFDIDRITVVVTYRVPRVKHLISIWRETKKKNESFKQWMLSTKNKLGATDSLGLAEKFLEKGLKVVIADIHGISEEGYDISNIIACQVLDATCTDEMQLVGSDPPLIMNTKQNFNGNININQDQLDLMDMVMQRYDCKYLEMFDKYKDSDQLITIYPTALLDVIQTCGDDKGDQKKIPDRKTMKELLVCIAEGVEDCE